MLKECSTVPSTTSSKNNRECPRPNKRRKLEPTTDIQSTVQCCICLEQPLVKDLAKVNGCEHRFCFNCIETWADRENTCPLCKIRITQIERCSESKENKLPSKNAVKKVKFCDQRTDSGRSIQHLLGKYTAVLFLFRNTAHFKMSQISRRMHYSSSLTVTIFRILSR